MPRHRLRMNNYPRHCHHNHKNNDYDNDAVLHQDAKTSFEDEQLSTPLPPQSQVQQSQSQQSSPEEVKQQIVDLLAKVAPADVAGSANQMMAQFEGKEEVLLQTLLAAQGRKVSESMSSDHALSPPSSPPYGPGVGPVGVGRMGSPSSRSFGGDDSIMDM